MYIEFELGLSGGNNIGYLLCTGDSVEGYYDPSYYEELYYDSGSESPITVATVNKSDLDVITITPTLYTAKASDTTVPVYFRGGHSDVENYGVGKHFDLALDGGAEAGETIVNTAYNETLVTCIIPAGQTTREITMTIVNNLILELDRDITILSPLFGAPKTVTIVDDNIPETEYPALSGNYYRNIINVLAPDDDYDSSTVDVRETTASELQAVADYDNTTDFEAIANWLDDNGGGIMYFPDGTYDLKYADIPLQTAATHPGITLWGESKLGTTLRKYFIGLTESVAGNPIVATQYNYTDAGLSFPVSFVNFTVDGNDLPIGERISSLDVSPVDKVFEIRRGSSTGPLDTFTFKATTDIPNKEIGTQLTTADQATEMALVMAGNGYNVSWVSDTVFNVTYTDYPALYSAVGTAVEEDYVDGQSFENAPGIRVGVSNPNSGELAQSIFENVYCKSVKNAEALSFSHNSDVTLYEISSDPDGSWGRGTIILNGAYNYFDFRNVDVHQLRLESASKGHDGVGASGYMNFLWNDCTFDVLNINSAGETESTSIFVFNNVTVNNNYSFVFGTTVGANLDTPVQFNNCNFTMDELSFFQYPVDIDFDTCRFVANYDAVAANLSPFYVIGDSDIAALITIRFDNCAFALGENAASTGYIAGIGCYWATTHTTTRIEVINSTWESDFTYQIASFVRGGMFVLGEGNTYNGTYLLLQNCAAGDLFGIDIDGTDWDISNLTYPVPFISNCRQNGNLYYCRNLELSDDKNVWVSTGNGNWGYWCDVNFVVKAYSSTDNGVMRTITGSGAPEDGTTVGMTNEDVAEGNSPDSFDIYYDSVGEDWYQCYNEADKLWQAYAP